MVLQTIDGGEEWPDSVWTCNVCGFQIHQQGVGGDVAECPACVSREYADDAEIEAAKELYKEIRRGKNAQIKPRAKKNRLRK